MSVLRLIKHGLSNWLWRSQTDRMLDRKGFANCTVHQDAEFLALFREIHASRTALLGLREMNNIYKLVQTAASVPGDIAEVGVYKGGSARLLGRTLAGSGKKLHLFDTFGGMPETDGRHDKHQAGDFADTSLRGVQRALDGIDGLEFHPGFFPQTAAGLESERFAFAHIDVDIYKSIADACEFFYPRLTHGGMLLFDDYGSPSCPGVKTAVDAFFDRVGEQTLYLPTGQCLVVKAHATGPAHVDAHVAAHVVAGVT